MSWQANMQVSFRAIGGTASTWDGDAMVAMSVELTAAAEPVPADLNSRLLAWLQLRLASTTADLNGLLAEWKAEHPDGVFDPSGVMPFFVAAGAGDDETVAATDLAVPYPAGLEAGDLLILHVGLRDRTAATATAAGFDVQYTDAHGASDLTQIILTKFAVGDETGNLAVNWDGDVVGMVATGRMYAYRDVALTDFLEGAAVATGASDTSVEFPTVTTLGSNRQVVCLTMWAVGATLGDAAGETGGDYAKPVAEYFTASGNDAGLCVQDADKAAAGALSGAVATLASSSPWVARAVALVPLAV